MPYRVSYNSQENVIELVLYGTVTEAESKKLIKKSIKISQKQECTDFLIDAQEMEIGPSITNTYYRPEQYSEGGLTRQSCAALILPEFSEGRETARFWETVCINHGWQVKSFETRGEAVKWLNRTPPQ